MVGREALRPRTEDRRGPAPPNGEADVEEAVFPHDGGGVLGAAQKLCHTAERKVPGFPLGLAHRPRTLGLLSVDERVIDAELRHRRYRRGTNRAALQR